MRKRITVLFTILTLVFVFSACQQTREIQKWDCSVSLPKNSTEVVKSATLVKTTTAELSIQNPSSIDLVWYLYEVDNPEAEPREMTLHAGGAGSMYQLKNNIDYCVGIQGSTPKDLDIRLIISDGPNPDPY